MKTWPKIPDDVVTWFRRTLAEANRQVSDLIMNVPNIRETTLDDMLVNALIPDLAPRRLGSGTIVRMDVHNIGGLRRWRRWETADIAILVFVYDANNLIAQKIGLLQSKRLYPDNHDVDDEDPVGFLYGMNAFLHAEASTAMDQLFQEYNFDQQCNYAMLMAGSQQVQRVEKHNQQAGEQVFYLFYNPPYLPATISYPRTSKHRSKSLHLGARVYTATDVHTYLGKLPDGQSPTVGGLEASGHSSNWPLQKWAADLLLTCKVGHVSAVQG